MVVVESCWMHRKAHRILRWKGRVEGWKGRVKRVSFRGSLGGGGTEMARFVWRERERVVWIKVEG